MLLNGAIAGSEIVALLTTDSSRLARPRYQVCPPPFGGTSPLTLCTVSWPSPGASRSSRLTHCHAEPSGHTIRTRLSHTRNPRGTKHCGPDRARVARFKIVCCRGRWSNDERGRYRSQTPGAGYPDTSLLRSPAALRCGRRGWIRSAAELDLGLRIAMLGSLGQSLGCCSAHYSIQFPRRQPRGTATQGSRPRPPVKQGAVARLGLAFCREPA